MKTKVSIRHVMVLLALCGLCGASVGILMNTAGLFYTPIATELGIGRGTVSLTMTFSAILAAIVGMLIPKFLKDKKSLKIIVIISSILMVGGTFMLSQSNALWELYLWNIVRGAGSGLTSFVLATMVLNQWFYTHHGLFTSLVLCFSGIPGALLSNLFSSFITNYGWHTAYMIISGIVLLFCLPGILFPIAYKPEEVGLKPVGYEEYQSVKKSAPEKMVIEGKNIEHAGRKMFFLLAFTAAGCIAAGLIHHLPGIAESAGFTAALGATMVAMVNLSNIIGKLLYGFTSDRIGTMKTSLIHAGIAGTALVMMFFFRTSLSLPVTAFFFGFSMANSATAMSLATSDIFGLQEYNHVYPIVSFVGSITNAFGVTLLGVLVDVTQSYDLLIVSGIILELLVGFSIFMLYHSDTDKKFG